MNPLENAQTELSTLMEQRDEINRKIEAVEQSIRIFLPVYGTPRDQFFAGSMLLSNPGITEAIERVLMAHPDQELAPTVVRDLLLAANFTVTGDNPMASIHQILKRLVNRGGPIQAVDTGAGTLYKYNSSIPPKPGPLSRRYGTPMEPPGMPLQQMAGGKMPPHDKTAIEKMAEMQADPVRRPGLDLAPYPRYRKGPVQPPKPGEFGKK